MGGTVPVSVFVIFLVLNSVFYEIECWSSKSKSSDDTSSLGSIAANARHDKVTLSGVSSGGTFAQMLQFSFSSLFSGVAVFSHAYYRCGPGNGDIDEYDRKCTRMFNSTMESRYNPDLVHKDIKDYFDQNLIEDPKNLKNTRLYVYAGLQNFLFSPDTSLNILRVYEPYIGSMRNIFTRVQDANLVLPTDSTTFGGPCTEYKESNLLIGQCGFSGLDEAIHFLLDMERTTNPGTRSSSRKRQVSMFDQREFTKGLQNPSMDDTGFYYVPKQCKKTDYNEQEERCYLHFYFHGCMTGKEYSNATHVENSGILEVADKLGIIVVFPQAKAPRDTMSGCWDTFGHTGPQYATQKGDQVTTVKRILDRVTGVDYDWQWH